MKKYIIFFSLLLISCTVIAQQVVDTIQKIVPGRVNSTEQQNKPYVILISIDGFRYDYAEKYHAQHLLDLANSGVKAEAMIPSFPSVTFPNHYAIASGLYPSHSGLVNNAYYAPDRKAIYNMNNKARVADGSWYGGTPLWVLAEQQHMLSASFYWVASEAPIKSINPTYYYAYNDKIGIHSRIGTVVSWLSLPPEKRPHLITFYFPQVDHEAHKHGVESTENQSAIHFVDSAIYELTEAVKRTGLNVNYVLVSDHGMANVDNEHPLPIPAVIDTNKFKISGESMIFGLYAKDANDIQSTYEALKKDQLGYKVYLKKDMPAYLHYGATDDYYNHIGDILLLADYPNVFRMGNLNRKIDPATHGYDPSAVKQMYATFYAWGPAFKPHLQIPAFPNVDVYPLITDILGLTYTEKIDGTKEIADKVLLKP
ncbi:ectonucleotide pyrophosphatase/phosphodiesterase [uncultured Mucilaginibacter sp.]|uniref:alkaline phosphatase family protein n=1 Tax=uncultured Mucilaginibacter sp. TaxID=797541 RepID=UPI0025DC8301|nr:ectonucleotide pyrophosphatase/phosphodiesterase [uncultured Mucilaginibacter sp.]